MVSRTASTATTSAVCAADKLDFGSIASTTYKLAGQPTQLGRKVANALLIIEEAIEKYEMEHIALSFNGGKDCTALMHLVRAALHKHSTARGQPTTALVSFCVDCFVKSSVGRYSLGLVEKSGSMQQGLQAFKDDHPEVQAIFVGTRRDDPYGDKLDFFSPTDAGWPQFMRVNPILDWTFDDVWGFIHGAAVPYCSLYDHGYTSLGDVETTVRNPALLKDGVYQPAWSLANGCLERSGRSASSSSQPSASLDVFAASN
ncbi:hypothetical protein BX661DRAFT_184771 [Kickxella alabastrina]|uniref:uncharacterized protein n=1 Tax=Kickxella alabastrina TaxID=61397 RepID=UPI00222048ED|nr:uncharacterized protein BX661DRAFT_184771 [Kickxella alabastrina]KAI7825531.1 hypothetical protein BX661DRAFT_184771 [Kickxella alabastrina]